VKVSSIECLLLAAVMEVAVRIVLPNLWPTVFQVVHVFAGFVQIVVA